MKDLDLILERLDRGEGSVFAGSNTRHLRQLARRVAELRPDADVFLGDINSGAPAYSGPRTGGTELVVRLRQP